MSRYPRRGRTACGDHGELDLAECGGDIREDCEEISGLFVFRESEIDRDGERVNRGPLGALERDLKGGGTAYIAPPVAILGNRANLLGNYAQQVGLKLRGLLPFGHFESADEPARVLGVEGARAVFQRDHVVEEVGLAASGGAADPEYGAVIGGQMLI